MNSNNVASLGAPVSRRQVDGKRRRHETRRRDASAPRIARLIPLSSQLVRGMLQTPNMKMEFQNVSATGQTAEGAAWWPEKN